MRIIYETSTKEVGFLLGAQPCDPYEKDAGCSRAPLCVWVVADSRGYAGQRHVVPLHEHYPGYSPSSTLCASLYRPVGWFTWLLRRCHPSMKLRPTELNKTQHRSVVAVCTGSSKPQST